MELERNRHLHTLSLREKQLIELAAKGYTDAEMARDLGIAVGTVATYWGRIRAKYGGCSRTELVAMAMEEAFEGEVQDLRTKAAALSTELRRATGNVGAPTNFYQAVVDAAPEAIVMVDPGGSIDYMNAAAEEMFGYEKSELVGKPLAMLLPERYRYIHGRHVLEFFSSPEKRTMGEHTATPALHKSGQEFGILASLSYVQTPSGVIVTCFIHKAPASPFAPR